MALPSSRRSKTLYFAYTAMISPRRLGVVAPGAEFQFIAHLPETRLIFPTSNGSWEGGLPSVRPEPGNTVWGAVFEIAEVELKAIDEAEADEGRKRANLSAMDRGGRRHEVVSHVFPESANGDQTPSRKYMAMVVEGGRHWSLPAGWVAGLEEYVADSIW